MRAPLCASILALLLNGCAAAPVSQDTPRAYDGFSIMPPQEPGWFVDTMTERKVVFRKSSNSDTHRMFVGVEVGEAPRAFGSPDEFLQYVNDTYFVANPKIYEFQVKDARLDAEHGEYCVAYHYRYKDFKSARPKQAPYLFREGRCFACLHPNAKHREYDVCYSEIFLPGEEDAQFRLAGDAFIRSLRFTEPGDGQRGPKDLTSIAADLIEGRNRVFFLQQFHHPSEVSVQLDGADVAELSGGEVAAARAAPGRHTVKAYLQGIGGLTLNRPELDFEMVADNPRYFVVRLKKGALLNRLEILEVTESAWKEQTGR